MEGVGEATLVEAGPPEQMLEAVLGTGLGILRRDPTSARALSSMSPEAFARAMEKRLLIITKANSRSTVHRSAYLDYISFKTFDAAGNVVGERRFLGLFSSAAYLSSVKDLPVVKRKVAEVMSRSGLSPRSHSGKELMATLEDYPREELFQIATDDLFKTVMGVLRLAGRRQVRCSRGPTSTAGSSRAWCTCHGTDSRPQTGCESRRSCWRSCTAPGWTTPRGSPTPPWRASTSSCAPSRAPGFERSTRRRCRPRLPKPPGSGMTTSRTRSTSSSAASRPAGCSSGTATRYPRRTRTPTRHMRRCRTSPCWRRSRSPGSSCCTSTSGARTAATCASRSSAQASR